MAPKEGRVAKPERLPPRYPHRLDSEEST